MNERARADRPRPPEDLDGEALLEWHRISEELDSLGLLDRADRAIMTLYARTWAQWHAANQHVTAFGAIVKGNNQVAGRSPFYTVVRETAAQLRGLLADMGLTPAARSKAARGDKAEEPEDLDI